MPRTRHSLPVTTLQVHPAVWRRALTLAEGNARRIEVIDELHVVVHNQPVR